MLKNNKYFKILNKVTNKKLRLFCFPYAGGSASIYLPFKDKIGDEIELIAVQLTGRAERMFEDPIKDMDELVNILYAQISHSLNEPFAFFGHSMGGSIAYALAKKIEQHSSNKPEFIVISATRPPYIHNQNNNHSLDDKALINVLKENKASPKEVLDSKELMEMILPSIRADYQLIETYKTPRTPTLLTPTIIFNDEDDIGKEIILSWQEYIKNEIKYVKFSGGHFFIHSQVDAIIKEIKNII